jgi:NADH dehydrogenase (ubiquinone) 1 alpha subcomplex subunit 5
MRIASRLLANVKPARFLEAGNPTGLTGLFTHAAPRSTLLYLYSVTLDKLRAIPDHSVYRQAVERIVQHRMGIVESIKPAGYDDWAERATKMVQEHPEIFNSNTPGPHGLSHHGGHSFVTTQQKAEEDERLEEWDGEEVTAGTLEGPRTAEERASQQFIAQKDYLIDQTAVRWEPEPQLEASQYVGLVAVAEFHLVAP